MGVCVFKTTTILNVNMIDGDADRAMILGKQFFVSPSDSLSVVVANAKCIPFFKNGLKVNRFVYWGFNDCYHYSLYYECED